MFYVVKDFCFQAKIQKYSLKKISFQTFRNNLHQKISVVVDFQNILQPILAPKFFLSQHLAASLKTQSIAEFLFEKFKYFGQTVSIIYLRLLIINALVRKLILCINELRVTVSFRLLENFIFIFQKENLSLNRHITSQTFTKNWLGCSKSFKRCG